MYEAIICQRAPARGPKATGLEPLEIAALGGVAAGQRYSDPAALKSGLLGCTPMLWRLTSRCASIGMALAARAGSSELARQAGWA